MFDKKDMEELRRVFGAEHDPGPDPDEVRVPDGVWIDDEPHVSAELNPLISGSTSPTGRPATSTCSSTSRTWCSPTR